MINYTFFYILILKIWLKLVNSGLNMYFCLLNAMLAYTLLMLQLEAFVHLLKLNIAVINYLPKWMFHLL